MTGIPREDAKLMVGAGWSKLIDEVYDRLPAESSVTTVKEKFSQLRIYINHAPPSFYEFLDDIEHRSGEICEFCGQPGKTRNLSNWMKTLCDTCAEMDRY